MNVKVGDTILIYIGAKVHLELQGKLAVVTEMRNWGVLADVPTFGGVAPVRLEWSGFSDHLRDFSKSKGGRQVCCNRCHTCGSELREVLDGELWCDTCGSYR